MSEPVPAHVTDVWACHLCHKATDARFPERCGIYGECGEILVPKSVLVAERTRSEEAEEKLAEAMREYDAAAHNCEAWSADCSRLEARSRELEDALTSIQGESYLAMLDAPDEVPDPLTACKNINRLARTALSEPGTPISSDRVSER